MKKLALLLATAGMIGFAGSAMADPNTNSETTGNPGFGNQGCSHPSADVWKNPGDAWRDIAQKGKDGGDNIHQFVQNNIFVWDPDPESVGDYVGLLCLRPGVDIVFD